MRNLTGIKNPNRPLRNAGKEVRYSRSSILLLGGGVFLLAISWLGGCSSGSQPTPDPTKEEVQTDSDRFFKHLEKEETKKEPKETRP